MIQTRHWKRHLKVGLCVAVGVAAILTGFVLFHHGEDIRNPLIEFLTLPIRVLINLARPVEKIYTSLPESVAICNILLFTAALWGALAALISGILSLLFSRETKPTPPR